jgi:hypothetical protein
VDERLQGNSIAAYGKSNQQGLGHQNEKDIRRYVL